MKPKPLEYNVFKGISKISLKRRPNMSESRRVASKSSTKVKIQWANKEANNLSMDQRNILNNSPEINKIKHQAILRKGAQSELKHAPQFRIINKANQGFKRVSIDQRNNK